MKSEVVLMYGESVIKCSQVAIEGMRLPTVDRTAIYTLNEQIRLMTSDSLMNNGLVATCTNPAKDGAQDTPA